MIKRAVQACLGKFRLRLVRTDIPPLVSMRDGLFPFFSAMQGLGFDPRHIVDVGANRGSWTRTAIEWFPHAHYTLIEPQADLKKCVDDLVAQGFSIEWINAGAGDTPGCFPFYLSGRDDASSFVSRGDRQIMVDVRTLDEIAASSSAPVPDLVKIDAEGMDLKVLSGASTLFGKTEFFLVEAMIAGEHENSLSAIVRKMDAAGYSPVDITSLNRSPKSGVLFLCELAFIKSSSRLLSINRSNVHCCDSSQTRRPSRHFAAT
jgi:FkbM family methyltransferase